MLFPRLLFFFAIHLLFFVNFSPYFLSSPYPSPDAVHPRHVCRTVRCVPRRTVRPRRLRHQLAPPPVVPCAWPRLRRAFWRRCRPSARESNKNRVIGVYHLWRSFLFIFSPPMLLVIGISCSLYLFYLLIIYFRFFSFLFSSPPPPPLPSATQPEPAAKSARACLAPPAPAAPEPILVRPGRPRRHPRRNLRWVDECAAAAQAEAALLSAAAAVSQAHECMSGSEMFVLVDDLHWAGSGSAEPEPMM